MKFLQLARLQVQFSLSHYIWIKFSSYKERFHIFNSGIIVLPIRSKRQDYEFQEFKWCEKRNRYVCRCALVETSKGRFPSSIEKYAAAVN